MDPLAPEYPFYTPYQFAGNKPINSIDLEGLENVPRFTAQDGCAGCSAREHQWASGEWTIDDTEFALAGAAFGGLFVFAAPKIIALANWAVAHPLETTFIGGTILSALDPNPTADYTPWLPGDEVLGNALGAFGTIIFKEFNYIGRGVLKESGRFFKEVARVNGKWITASVTQHEQKIIDMLLKEGSEVAVLIPKSDKGLVGRTADILLDGIATEIKQMKNAVVRTGKSASDELSGSIADVVKKSRKGGGQASNLILDVSEQTGMSRDIAVRGANRVFGNHSGVKSLRIIGKDFDETIKRGND